MSDQALGSLLSKRLPLVAAFIVAFAAVATPIAISVYWAQKLAFDEQMAAVGALADETLRRTDVYADEMDNGFSILEASAGNPCSDEKIDVMRQVEMLSEQVRLFGYVLDDRLMCTSFGRAGKNDAGIPIGPALFRHGTTQTRHGTTQTRASVELPVVPGMVPGMQFLVVTRENSGYTAIVHADVLSTVFGDRPGMSVGVFSAPAKRMIVRRGEFRQGWLDALGNAARIDFTDGNYLVAVRRSRAYPLSAYAAVPKQRVVEGLRRAALVLVPVGALAGAIFAWIVRYIVRRRLGMAALLKMALKREELFLVYQPIVELHGGRCVGAEALVRWRRPDGEMIRPDVFIPIAEETGLIHEVTKRVMDLVARDARELLRARPELHIGLNLSAQDLQMEETGHLVAGLIRTMGVKPGNLLIEATERGFMQPEVARRILDDIRSLKVKIAIDDFGTGYSSLSYLEKFKLDYLKIDKSFVDTMGGAAATGRVAFHIIEMAKALKLEMIAEGVETEAQVRYLQEHGVQYAQGWFFGKPGPIRELAAFVAHTEKTAA